MRKKLLFVNLEKEVPQTRAKQQIVAQLKVYLRIERELTCQVVEDYYFEGWVRGVELRVVQGIGLIPIPLHSGVQINSRHEEELLSIPERLSLRVQIVCTFVMK
jgi:hypothetical protein